MHFFLFWVQAQTNGFVTRFDSATIALKSLEQYSLSNVSTRDVLQKLECFSSKIQDSIDIAFMKICPNEKGMQSLRQNINYELEQCMQTVFTISRNHIITPTHSILPTILYFQILNNFPGNVENYHGIYTLHLARHLYQ